MSHYITASIVLLKRSRGWIGEKEIEREREREGGREKKKDTRMNSMCNECESIRVCEMVSR